METFYKQSCMTMQMEIGTAIDKTRFLSKRKFWLWRSVELLALKFYNQMKIFKMSHRVKLIFMLKDDVNKAVHGLKCLNPLSFRYEKRKNSQIENRMFCWVVEGYDRVVVVLRSSEWRVDVVLHPTLRFFFLSLFKW